ATSQAPVNPFRFTGEYRDSTTGLYHLRARAYDPTTGRFTAVDPVSPAVGDPYVGAYVYVRNNPVRYTDPSGQESRPADQPCNLSPAGRAGRVVGGVVLVGGGVLVSALGILVIGLGLGELGAAGAETVATGGLAGPVAVLQAAGGIQLATLYGPAQIVVGATAVGVGGATVASAFCP
ncbi:MAG: RHS repeat-associated core domain-containing protein, partial [Chloroflexi bacterium]|nr:RHS repeat-associated core domain-containing protein [Chloroflexota bacterium]